VTKDRRLGRGLAALLGSPMEEEHSVEGAPPTATINRTLSNNPRAATRTSVTGSIPLNDNPIATGTNVAKQTLELSVHEIDNNPFQPRRKFNPEEIASLAASICEHEQLQPILVRQVGQRYQLISGERRLRATIHAGLKTIRAEVRQADDRLVAELAIVENLQRKDLDAIEKAMSFRRYIDQHKCTQEDLAKRLKIDRSTIANLMRLLELPEEIQECIQNDTVTAGHARALLPLGDEGQQLEFARLIQAENWNVRETERRVAEALAAEDNSKAVSSVGFTRPSRKKNSPHITALEQQLRSALGTKTEIRVNSTGRGKITINFANADEFERLCQLICPDVELKRAA
jgi:ParB family transcriptional regulator, chromosome partitioning protein